MSTGKKIGIIVAGLTVVGIGAGVALANGGGKRGGRFQDPAKIAQFDKNKDGKLDQTERAAMHQAMRAEHEKMRAEKLAKYDKNKDGKLDDAERTVMRDDHIKQRFGEIDANKDGSISFDEFKAHAPKGPRGAGMRNGFRGGFRGGFKGTR